jgi:outer membrane receptor protein involved in Fe transport
VEAARTRGAELGARFDVGPLRGRAEYAYLDAFNEETGLTLDRRATHTGLVRLGTTLGIRSGLDVDVSLIYTGDSPLIGTGDDGLPAVVATQEALTSVDIQTGFRVLEGYLVTVGVQNLFNDNPAGWQGINQRRLRFGAEARDIF